MTLVGPVGELACLEGGGVDGVLASERFGLAGVPGPVTVAQRLYQANHRSDISQLECQNIENL